MVYLDVFGPEILMILIALPEDIWNLQFILV